MRIGSARALNHSEYSSARASVSLGALTWGQQPCAPSVEHCAGGLTGLRVNYPSTKVNICSGGGKLSGRSAVVQPVVLVRGRLICETYGGMVSFLDLIRRRSGSGGYSRRESIRVGNGTRCHKNVILMVVNGGKMRTKGE